MPQPSYPYAMGRISVLSTKLLGAVKLRRIAEAPTIQESLALLLETGYGGDASSSANLSEEIDYLIRAQLQQSRRIVWELTPDPVRTRLFLLEADTHNLKVFLKCRLLGIEAPDVLYEGGAFPVELLQNCVQAKNYEALPPAYCKAMNKVEQELQRQVDPLEFSARIDGAMFTFIKEELDKLHDKSFVRKYFTLMVDFQNLRSLIRARALQWDASKLLPLLLEGGELETKLFQEAYDVPLDQLGNKLKHGTNGSLLAEALEDYNSKKEAGVFQKRLGAALQEIVRKAAINRFGLGPVIAYLLGRSEEAKALRMIFNAKKSGLEYELPEVLV